MSAPAFRAQVPILQVADLERTVAFYERLGFTLRDAVRASDGRMQWASLDADGTELMFARAESALAPESQAAMLYLYTDDVAAMHAHLAARGIEVGAIAAPFWSPRGEFRVTDPDGWCLVVSHT